MSKPKFNRHEILKADYVSEIMKLDWDQIVKDAKRNLFLDRKGKPDLYQFCLEYIWDLLPPEKYKTVKERVFFAAINEVATKHGGYITRGKCERDLVFFNIDAKETQ
jgi:hypothetical protein